MAPACLPVQATPVDPGDLVGVWVVSRGALEVNVRPRSISSVKAAAKELQCSRGEVRQAMEDYKHRDDAPEPFVLTIGSGDNLVEIEGATPLLALDEACKAPGEFIRWSGTDELCAVDIDTTRAMDRAWIHDLAYRGGADRAWLSRNGGGRLVFQNDATNSARERACAAAVLLDIAYHADVDRVEILSNTRKPTGPVIAETEALKDGGSIPWLIAHVVGKEISEAQAESVDGWLERVGLQRNRRAPHSLCPIEPKRVKGDNPVIALDGGVYCYRCANTNGDGFRSYGALLGEWEEKANPLVEAARRRVHWEHQKVVLGADWPAGLEVGAAGSPIPRS